MMMIIPCPTFGRCVLMRSHIFISDLTYDHHIPSCRHFHHVRLTGIFKFSYRYLMMHNIFSPKLSCPFLTSSMLVLVYPVSISLLNSPHSSTFLHLIFFFRSIWFDPQGCKRKFDVPAFVAKYPPAAANAANVNRTRKLWERWRGSAPLCRIGRGEGRGEDAVGRCIAL